MYKRCFCAMAVVLLLSLALTGPVEAELAGWWPMNDGAGTTAVDATGNGNDAAFNGDPQWVVGQLDGALEFDGAGDWLECADGGTLAIGEAVSMAAWFKVSALGIDHKIGGNQDNANGGYKMSIYNNDKVEFEIRTASNTAVLNRNVAGGTVLETDTWYHVVGVYSLADGYIRTYINGVLDRELATTDALGVSPGPLRLGCEPYTTGSYHFNGVMDDVRVYDHAVTEAEMPLIMLGGRPAELASNPDPADEASDLPRDVVLGWTPGSAAVTHDVYLGTTFEDVNSADRGNPMGVLAGQGQTQASLDPDGLLEFGQTYYWRVDEVNGAPDFAIFRGDVWSFTAEPFAYPIAGVTATTDGIYEPGADPENTVNGSGLNELDQHSAASDDMFLASPADGTVSVEYEFDQVYKLHEMLVWNYNVQFEIILGFGFKDVTIEYSENGTDWMTLGDVQFAQATARADYVANTTVAFNGVPAKYVRLTANTGYGMMGQYGLSEVRFMYIPANAREPQPADGATDVSIATALSWRAGREAVSHDVYYGTDAEALALAGSTTAASYSPGALEMATTYYWKVDEVNEADETSVWPGRVWSFMTQEFIVVDDFESYTDDESSRIYETWIDGWINETGSTVGHLSSPFAEQEIVHSGGQSMPLRYDNAGVATSEAELPLNQNWTVSGIQSLALYFYGDPDNTGGQLYVTVNGTRVNYDGSAAILADPGWHLWSIDLAASGASLSNVTSLTIGIEGAGASGILYIDDIRLYPEVLDYYRFADITAPGDTVVGVPNDGDWPAAEYPDLAIDDNVNTKFLHRKGGAQATGIQVTPAVGPTIVTGLTLTTANDTPTRDPASYELYGSNGTIDGPYELIAAGDVVDFTGQTEWPRFTKNETVIKFENEVAYAHYQIVFPTLRGESETLMQIAEIELIGTAN